MEATIEDSSLGDLLLFVEVAELGSFSAAARRRGLARSVVSRTIQRLESQAGARLCHRTTRRLSLTDAGERLKRELDAPLRQLLDALTEAAHAEGTIRGTVRVSMSHGFGRAFVLPELARITREHPDLRFELDLSDEIRNLVGARVDIAIRIGPVADASMIARRIGTVPLVLVAVPTLAERVTDLRELAAAPCVSFRVPTTGELLAWDLLVEDRIESFHPEDVRAVSDSIEGLADLARLGLGVACVPHYLASPALASGELVRISGIEAGPGPEVRLCHLGRKTMPRRVGVVLDHLVDAFQRDDRFATIGSQPTA